MQPALADQFQHDGVVRLPGFYPRSQMAPWQRQVLAELQRLHLWTGHKRLPNAMHGLPPFQQIAKVSGLVRVPGLHAALVTAPLLQRLAELDDRQPLAQTTRWLISLPHAGGWSLSGLPWHVDAKAGPQGQRPDIQAFVLIDDVAPRGGGTLVLAGTHRADVDVAALRAQLRLGDDAEAVARQHGVEVIEMTGHAGDLYLMDMRLLHAPSRNAGKELRLMATTRFLLAS